jgi:DNA modification methylase
MVELIWDGKYDATGKRTAPLRVALPFQTVETVNESAQQRQRSLFSLMQGQQSEWRNRLIWGDKKYVLPSLLPEFAGKVDLIYIDPPFATGADFSFSAEVGDETFEKVPSVVEQKAYRDTWGRGVDGYLHWLYETILFLHELLSEKGSLYVHLDYRMSSYAKAVLDEIFGPDQFQNEITWKRTSSHSDSGAYGNSHDTILFFAKGVGTWNSPLQSYDQDYIDQYYRYSDPDGRKWMSDNLSAAGLSGGGYTYSWKGVTRTWRCPQSTMQRLDDEGKLYYTKNGIPRLKRYLDESKGGLPAQDLWTDIQAVRSWHSELIAYPTQKPEALLERIIKASSNEGDLVLDCFCGSGTTAAVAEKLGRRWITCDLGRFAIHTARKRLLAIPDVKPFEVQNLGKYERQVWQKAEFGENAAALQHAYRTFILDLYHADALEGYSWLHGLKAGRYVHVGAVDSPVTRADVQQAAAELRRAQGQATGAKTAAVDMLGWEFALDMNETVRQEAEASGVSVRFLKIPREVLEKKAVEQGDIHFFELAALGVETITIKREVTVKLTDFMVPRDDVPADVQQAVKQWSDWVDYWAVDWDYKDDTFHNQWQSYRTRKDRTLLLQAAHLYEEPGEYDVLVKVIDILGNDTTKAVRVRVG